MKPAELDELLLTGRIGVLVRGPLGEREDFDAARLDGRFSERLVVDEESDDAAVVVYELEVNEVTARRSD